MVREVASVTATPLDNWFKEDDYPPLRKAMAEIGGLLVDSINDKVGLEDFSKSLPNLDNWLMSQAISPRARIWLGTFWDEAIRLSLNIAESVASMSEEKVNEIIREHAQSRGNVTNGKAR